MPNSEPKNNRGYLGTTTEIAVNVPDSLRKDIHYYEHEQAQYDLEKVAAEFPRQQAKGMHRFIDLLPVDRLRIRLSKTEGDTPINRLEKFGGKRGFSQLFMKDEGQNPTGCFKDRESQLMVSMAMERGEKAVYVISSGNAALSTAAYAQAAGIECTCYIPEKTAPEKQALIRKYGAKLHTIPGFYEDVYRTVADMDPPPPGWNVTTGLNPFRTEADKTISYEIWLQSREADRPIPKTIVVPSGNGGSLAGIWQGFVELEKMGFISEDELPQMVSVQVKGAAPFSEALRHHSDIAILHGIDDSIAEGIVAEESYSSIKAIHALRESGGYVVEVTDPEIIASLREIISEEGIVPEPTTAAVYAAVAHLHNAPDDHILLLHTGDGRRMPEEIEHVLHSVR